jgi:hypothetical protein
MGIGAAEKTNKTGGPHSTPNLSPLTVIGPPGNVNVTADADSGGPALAHVPGLPKPMKRSSPG